MQNINNYSRFWHSIYGLTPANILLFAGIFSLFFMTQCSVPPSKNTGNQQMEKPTDFKGQWAKMDNQSCSDQYPDFIEFQENGLYEGGKKNKGTFCMWDVGTFELASDHEMKISTANDAVISYKYTYENEILSIVISEDCIVKFKRV